MKIIFLTNNPITVNLINWLNTNNKVIVIEDKITRELILENKPELVVSYNYRFIIKEDVLKLIPEKMINLHISYLPWNRGAYPNIWSFLKNTPKGVTIHLIDKGIDTGPILFQKEVFFDEENETLASSFQVLHNEIQSLFIESWGKIKNFDFTPKYQNLCDGSINYIKDFEKIKHLIRNEGWNISIKSLKRKYNDYKNS